MALICGKKAREVLASAVPIDMAEVFQGVHIFPYTLARFSRR